MKDIPGASLPRRDFLKTAALAGTAQVLAGSLIANHHVTGSDRLRVGLIGCGGRGTGAAADMLMADPGVEIVALADLFADRVEGAKSRIEGRLKRHFDGDEMMAAKVLKERFKVTPAQQFDGWDNHKQLCALDDVDIVITATPPVFRPHVVEAALAQNKHMFIEKPVAVDAVGVRRMYALAEVADRKGLSIVSGTQRRYHTGYIEARDRILNGQIGEILSTQAYWLMGGFVGIPFRGADNVPTREMEFQIRNWLLFVWGSGDHIVEQHIHNMDVVNWIVGRTPEIALGMGGRAIESNGPRFGDRFSHFSVEYDYGEGLLCASQCRQEPGTVGRVSERIQGTKGIATLSLGQQRIEGEQPWTYELPADFVDSMVAEHKALIASIRNEKPVNTLREVTDSTLTMIVGRMSAFTGRQLKTAWVRERSQLDLTPKMAFGELPVPSVRIPGQEKLV